MKTYDNSGRLLSDITESVRPGFGVIRTQTTYGPGERVISQTVTTREFSGTVRTFEILNGKAPPVTITGPGTTAPAAVPLLFGAATTVSQTNIASKTAAPRVASSWRFGLRAS